MQCKSMEKIHNSHLLSAIISILLFISAISVFNIDFFELYLDNDYVNNMKSSVYSFRTVISMATLPARLPVMLSNVLPTLLQQKKYAPLDAVWIHVATNLLQDPSFTLSHTKQYIFSRFDSCNSNVQHQNIVLLCSKNPYIYFVFPSKNQKDLGPATKLLGILQFETDPSTRIVTVDDDVMYDPRMLYNLLLHEPRNFQSALGFSCEIQPPTDNTSNWIAINSENGWWKYPFQSVVDCKGWLHGYQGILYRRGFFQDSDVYNTSFMPSGCLLHDDVRIAGYLAKRGIRRSVYPHFTRFFMDRYTHLPRNRSNALSLIPGSMLHYQWPCVKYFQNFWRV